MKKNRFHLVGAVSLILLIMACKKEETYKCPELVKNGNFESGNNGFTSEYGYCNSSGCLDPSGNSHYAIGNNPKFFNSFLAEVEGKGNFMIVNGADDRRILWKQSVNVSQNSTYNLSFRLITLFEKSPAQLDIFVNNTKLGTINAPAYGQPWSQFKLSWTSGSSTTATLKILDANRTVLGNDFGLDDISFKEACNIINKHNY